MQCNEKERKKETTAKSLSSWLLAVIVQRHIRERLKERRIQRVDPVVTHGRARREWRPSRCTGSNHNFALVQMKRCRLIHLSEIGRVDAIGGGRNDLLKKMSKMSIFSYCHQGVALAMRAYNKDNPFIGQK
jgi:hypothetical protein